MARPAATTEQKIYDLFAQIESPADQAVVIAELQKFQRFCAKRDGKKPAGRHDLTPDQQAGALDLQAPANPQLSEALSGRKP